VRVGRALGERVQRERPGDSRAQVRRAWELTQGRHPGPAEEDRFLAAWSEQTEQLREYATKNPPPKGAPPADSQLDALGSLCQALLASNRFLHLE
jgi:hypothetical protein